MKIIKGIMIGAIFGFGLSFVGSFLFMLIAQAIAGGVMSVFGESWMYYATVIPFTLTFAIFGYYFTRNKGISNKKLWLYSGVSALFVTLYSGTIGALFGEYVRRGGDLRTYTENGFTGVNVEGVLGWGTIYAFILLPLTVPFARLVIEGFLFVLAEKDYLVSARWSSFIRFLKSVHVAAAFRSFVNLIPLLK